MAYEKNINLDIIYQVLPEYDPISKSDEEHDYNKKYKCIDTKTGDIYLRYNPRYGYHKEFVMSYAEAKKIVDKSDRKPSKNDYYTTPSKERYDEKD